MIAHIWSIVCKSSSIDSLTNTLSVFTVVEEIQATFRIPETSSIGPDNPIQLPVDMQVITLWRRGELDTPERGRGRSRLLRPGEIAAKAAAQPYEVDLSVAPRHRQIGRIMSIPFTTDGTYSLVIEREDGGEWVEVGRVPLEIAVTFVREEETSMNDTSL